MHPEFLGFLFGLAVIGGAGLAFIKHEWWRTVKSTYNRDRVTPGQKRNALIWPSH